MDGTTITINAILSAIISGTVSYFFYSWQKRTDHQFEYRKYILEKRKKVYNETEELISGITFTKYIVTASEKVINSQSIVVPGFITAGTPKEVDDFNTKVVSVMNQGFWLSDHMYEKLRETNKLLLRMINQVGIVDPYLSLAEIGTFKHELHVLGKSITDIYFIDICNLDDIDLFKKKKIYF